MIFLIFTLAFVNIVFNWGKKFSSDRIFHMIPTRYVLHNNPAG